MLEERKTNRGAQSCLARVGKNAALNSTDWNGGITLCQSDFFDMGKKKLCKSSTRFLYWKNVSEFLTLYLASIYKDDLHIFLNSFPVLWPDLEKYAMLTFQVLVPNHLLHIWKSYLAKGEESFKTAKPFGEFPKYNPGSSITNIHKQVAVWVLWTARNFWKVWHLTCKVVLRFRHVNLRLQSSKPLSSSWGVNIDKVPVKFLRLLRYHFWKYPK